MLITQLPLNTPPTPSSTVLTIGMLSRAVMPFFCLIQCGAPYLWRPLPFNPRPHFTLQLRPSLQWGPSLPTTGQNGRSSRKTLGPAGMASRSRHRRPRPSCRASSIFCSR